MHEESSTQPRRYRVIVSGCLGERFASGFHGLEVELHAGRTSLVGGFADPAQLHGLLDRLRDLGITLISVNPID